MQSISKNKEFLNNLFKKHFDEDFINKVSSAYDEYLNAYKSKHGEIHAWYSYNRSNNVGWDYNAVPRKPGNTGKYPIQEMSEVSAYLKGLLNTHNLATLAFIMMNPEKFKGLTFCDFGAGMGVMGAFISKLGYECYNYDNFYHVSNMGDTVGLHKFLFDRGVSMKEVLSTPPPKKIDVLMVHGIYAEDSDFFDSNDNFKYLFLDKRYDTWPSSIEFLKKRAHALCHKQNLLSHMALYCLCDEVDND
tara:strand:- start:551 stop:1288 length:738 start_codon:yes stop_codon:yes gene_type:complete